MTDTRVASAAVKAAQQPNPSTLVAVGAVKVLQQLHAIVPADVYLAAASAQALHEPAPWIYARAAALAVLIRRPEPLPDNGAPFQWHAPDPDAVSGWVVDADRTSALVAWTATHGRDDAVSKASPSSVTLELDARLAAAPEIGALFRIVTTAGVWGTSLAGEQRVRVTAEVTDVVHDVRARRINVTAVGRLARHGRRPLDMRGMGTRLDGAAVARILTAAGAQVGELDAGTAAVLPPVADNRTAAQLLDDVTDSTLGVVVEQRNGDVDYHDDDHRRASEPVVTLSAAELELAGFTWTKRTRGIVTAVDVAYGRDAEHVRVRLDVDDEYPDERATLLVDASAAYDLGSTIVGRYAEPRWQLPTVPVNLHRVLTDPVKRSAVLGLSLGDRLTLTGLPAGGDYTDTDVFVEGTVEHVRVYLPSEDAPLLPVEDRTAWTLELAVSDPTLSGVTFRWVDVDDAVTWDDVDPDLTWLDLTRAEHPETLTNP